MMTNNRKRGLALPEVQIDICPESAGLILSVGPVSVWLSEATAKQVAAELTSALARGRGTLDIHAATTEESN